MAILSRFQIKREQIISEDRENCWTMKKKRGEVDQQHVYFNYFQLNWVP